MTTIFNADLSSETTRNDGKVMVLPGYNPSTMQPFTSEAQVAAYIETVRSNELFWSTPAAPATSKSMTPIRFKLALGQDARLAIRDAVDYAGNDPAELTKKAILADWWDILNDKTLTEVNVEDPDTIAALGYLVSIGFLTETQRDNILLGVPV